MESELEVQCARRLGDSWRLISDSGDLADELTPKNWPLQRVKMQF